MSILIYSSLYRSEQHLAQYTHHVTLFAHQVKQAGIDVHYIPVVNDASEKEQNYINTMAERINSAHDGRVTPLYVGRETLYASWNRAIRSSSAPYFSSWNADDIRSAAGFIEGYRALENGADLVDFRFTGVTHFKRWGLFPTVENRISETLYHPEKFSRKNGLGPFFMARRKLYEQVGAFDENFRICGDLEWAGRVQLHAKFYSPKENGGQFIIHGDNLSNTGASREDIEVNIVFMRRGQWEQVIPTEPSPLREAWETWGNVNNISLPQSVADYLWGDGAQERYMAFKRERNQAAFIRRMRARLASRGILHSAEWSAYHMQFGD